MRVPAAVVVLAACDWSCNAGEHCARRLELDTPRVTRLACR